MARQVALITGASMGLGREYAGLCAKDGMDVVLVARSRDKLEALARTLREAHGVEAHVLPVDLDASDASEQVARGVEALGLEVDVLINNAGFGSTGAFVEADLARERSMIHVNVEALVALTHVFARKMVARGRGKVLLVASSVAFQPAPGMAVYAASKAFVLSFGEALAYELAGTGVSVTTHCPGATATEFANVAGNADTKLFQTKALVASSEDCAAHGFDAMKRGKRLSIHGLVNALATFSVRLSPRWLVLVVAGALTGFQRRATRDGK